MEGPKTIAGTSDTIIADPEVPFRPEVKGVELDFDRAFGIPVDEFTVIVIPAVGVFGRGLDSVLVRQSTTAGAIINCEQKVWLMESEPTGEASFGLLIYGEDRKPLISGQGRLVERDDALEYDIATVYDNVQSSPRADTVKGSGKCKTDGSGCEVGVEWSVTF